MFKYIITFIVIFFSLQNLNAQVPEDVEENYGGFAWGIKSGLTVGTQKWNGTDRNPLLRYHGVLFMESIRNPNSALYGQIGYHIRGSSVQFASFVDQQTANLFRGFSEGYQFKNIVLGVGMKQKKDFRNNLKYFYGFGLRMEFTAKTNLPKLDTGNPYFGFFPFDDPATVKRLLGGFDVSGGFEMKFSEMVGGILQFTISPDFSRQYLQFPVNNVRDPFTGQNTTIPGQDIRNLSLEVSLGIKLLRKVIYVD